MYQLNMSKKSSKFPIDRRYNYNFATKGTLIDPEYAICYPVEAKKKDEGQDQ